jgi:hypothetical protein
MSRPRVLCLLSADFGEYVTASLFARGQPFDVHFALPPALAAFMPAGQRGHSVYADFSQAHALVTSARPDVVLLASGYLFAVNRLAAPEALEAFVRFVRNSGAALATTDPWLRIWALRPGTRFAIHSLATGGEDAALSARMCALQASLEALFAGVPHLFAVPLADAQRRWLPFFNHAFGRAATVRAAAGGWLFVLSKEDYIFLAGFEKQAFFERLEQRIRRLLARPENRLRFVAPPEIGRWLGERWGDEPRVQHIAFCDFARFERLLREASVVAYWNILSSSLLYCLYHGIPPVFFGAGHLAKVCPGLETHAAQHVYCGRPPPLIEAEDLEPDAEKLVQEKGLRAWVAGLREEYARSPAPARALSAIRELA